MPQRISRSCNRLETFNGRIEDRVPSVRQKALHREMIVNGIGTGVRERPCRGHSQQSHHQGELHCPLPRMPERPHQCNGKTNSHGPWRTHLSKEKASAAQSQSDKQCHQHKAFHAGQPAHPPPFTSTAKESAHSVRPHNTACPLLCTRGEAYHSPTMNTTRADTLTRAQPKIVVHRSEGGSFSANELILLQAKKVPWLTHGVRTQ